MAGIADRRVVVVAAAFGVSDVSSIDMGEGSCSCGFILSEEARFLLVVSFFRALGVSDASPVASSVAFSSLSARVFLLEDDLVFLVDDGALTVLGDAVFFSFEDFALGVISLLSQRIKVAIMLQSNDLLHNKGIKQI